MYEIIHIWTAVVDESEEWSSHRQRGGHGFEFRWSPDFFFQASSFQLLKLENLLRWSFFTFIYNRSSKWIISYTSHHGSEVFFKFSADQLFVFNCSRAQVNFFKVRIQSLNHSWRASLLALAIYYFSILIYWLCSKLKNTVKELTSPGSGFPQHLFSPFV